MVVWMGHRAGLDCVVWMGHGAGLDGDHHADEEYERVDRLDLDNRRDRCDEPREAQDLLLESYY